MFRDYRPFLDKIYGQSDSKISKINRKWAKPAKVQYFAKHQLPYIS